MILIDDVYQKVLALTNKEQRGYITPQEFNLLANKAQLDIFDSYFYDLRTAFNKPKHNHPAIDETDSIREKLHTFIRNSEIEINSDNPQINSHELPSGLYKIDLITYKYPVGFDQPDGFNVLEIIYNTVPMDELDQKQVAFTEMHPLTKASAARPVFARIQSGQFATNKIAIYPDPTQYVTATQNLISFNISYWTRPTPPKWAYVIVNGKPLHDSTFGVTVNFELHKSEEERLVTKILQLAGVVIESPEIVQTAMVDHANTNREKND
tara:strand:+ start:105 stop:905 length:801 start_codon:yes stop_codon:yes gene_type:complete